MVTRSVYGLLFLSNPLWGINRLRDSGLRDFEEVGSTGTGTSWARPDFKAAARCLSRETSVPDPDT